MNLLYFIDDWVEVCNTFQVDMQVQAILNSTQKGTLISCFHKQYLSNIYIYSDFSVVSRSFTC